MSCCCGDEDEEPPPEKKGDAILVVLDTTIPPGTPEEDAAAIAQECIMRMKPNDGLVYADKNTTDENGVTTAAYYRGCKQRYLSCPPCRSTDALAACRPHERSGRS